MFEGVVNAWQSIPDMGAFLYASGMVIFNLIRRHGRQ